MANLSMYSLQGHDEIIVRTKGGPSKKQIKTNPQFEAVRRNNREWSGCTLMSRQIRNAFYPMNRLEDFPLTGSLNALCKHIQKRDESAEHGARAILLSQHRDLLKGISFSRKQVLESVLRVPISCAVDRTTATATVDIPVVLTDLYLYNFRTLPYFRIVACLGGVCDVSYSATDNSWSHADENYLDKQKGIFESEWFPTTGSIPAIHLTLSYPKDSTPLPDSLSLVLALGVEFGKNGIAHTIEAVKYSGTGKVMECV